VRVPREEWSIDGDGGRGLRRLLRGSGDGAPGRDAADVTGGPYVFYVDAIGMPSIVNTLAGPTSATYTR
jgi:hypothetical protein